MGRRSITSTVVIPPGHARRTIVPFVTAVPLIVARSAHPGILQPRVRVRVRVRVSVLPSRDRGSRRGGEEGDLIWMEVACVARTVMVAVSPNGYREVVVTVAFGSVALAGTSEATTAEPSRGSCDPTMGLQSLWVTALGGKGRPVVSVGFMVGS